MRFIYFLYGGLLLISSAVGFIYFTLFSYDAQWEQWLSASILGIVGGIFLSVSDDYKKSPTNKSLTVDKEKQ